MLKIETKRKIRHEVQTLQANDMYGIVKIFGKNTFCGQKNNDKLDKDFKLSDLCLFVGADKDSFSCLDCRTPNYSTLDEIRKEFIKIYQDYSQKEHGYFFRIIRLHESILIKGVKK